MVDLPLQGGIPQAEVGGTQEEELEVEEELEAEAEEEQAQEQAQEEEGAPNYWELNLETSSEIAWMLIAS